MTEVAVDARSSMEPKYSERVRAVEQIVAKLQACEDIDENIRFEDIPAERLAQLRELVDAGLLTDAEYEEKRQRIVSAL